MENDLSALAVNGKEDTIVDFLRKAANFMCFGNVEPRIYGL